MAQRANDPDRRSSGRRNFAAFLLMLLPGFMFLGVLAPAAVSVKPKVEETYGPLSFRGFAPRRPLQVPHLVHAALDGTTIAVDTVVFSGARYIAEQSQRVFEADAEQPDEENAIVLAANDSVEEYVSESLFSGAGDTVQLRVDLQPLWDPARFDIIPGPIARNGWQQWDDFHGVNMSLNPRRPIAIPEPTTGALLALGLGALALHRRARR